MAIPSAFYVIPGARKAQAQLNFWTSSWIPPPPGDPADQPYKILLVHAHPDPTSFSAAVANTFAESAVNLGHTVKRISLYSHDEESRNYQASLSRTERNMYLAEHKTMDATVSAHIDMMKWCDTLVFVYPTWWMNVPAILKGFLDRTLLKGETWDFVAPSSATSGPTGFIPKLTNIHRIVGISTYGATFPTVTAAGDNGRRMLANAIRPVLHPTATVRWLGLYNIEELSTDQRTDFLHEVKQMVEKL